MGWKDLPWWLIGMTTSTIIYLVTKLIANISLEKLAQTSTYSNYDVGWGYFFGLVLLPLLIGIIIITLIISFILQKKGITQFKIKHFIILGIVIIIFFLSSFAFKNLFPITYYQDLNSCSKYTSGLQQDICIDIVCGRENNIARLDPLYKQCITDTAASLDPNDPNLNTLIYSKCMSSKDKCLLDASLELNRVYACTYTESRTSQCKCLFDIWSKYGFTEYESNEYLPESFPETCPEQNRNTYDQVRRGLCLAIKSKNSTPCELL